MFTDASAAGWPCRGHLSLCIFGTGRGVGMPPSKTILVTDLAYRCTQGDLLAHFTRNIGELSAMVESASKPDGKRVGQ